MVLNIAVIIQNYFSVELRLGFSSFVSVLNVCGILFLLEVGILGANSPIFPAEMNVKMCNNS